MTEAEQMKEYIRFGEIPKDETSKIGNGCIGDGYEVIGYEKGVSVWDCVYNFDIGLYQLVAPHPTRFTSGDFSQSYDPENCCGCASNEKIYVVTGIEVGYGADNEPLLKDVKIVKELPFDYFKQKVISDRKIKGYKRIAELEAQIEKMKNCKNCKKLKKEKDGLLVCSVGSLYTNTFGKNCNKWELKTND